MTTGRAVDDRRDEPGDGVQTAGCQPSKPISVLKVFGRMDRAGVEIRALNLLRRADPAEVRLAFCVTSGLPGALDAQIRELGSEVYYCPVGPGFPFRLWRLLRATRPDVVHSGTATFSGVVLAVAALAGVPRRVAWFYSSADRHGDSLRGRLQRAVARTLLDVSATAIGAVSESAMDGLWRGGWRSDPRCRVVYNGLDVENYTLALDAVPAVRVSATAGAETVQVVHVARPDPLKNRVRAVGVVAAARALGTDARLSVVGRQDDAETAAVLARARDLGVAPYVEFSGESFDVPALLAGASLLLLTSLHEGLPTVVLEACAVGTPVLSSELPGVREIARRLPGVTMLPLAADDETWARALRSATTPPPTAASRRAANEAFARSPFRMELWERGLRSAWA